MQRRSEVKELVGLAQIVPDADANPELVIQAAREQLRGRFRAMRVDEIGVDELEHVGIAQVRKDAQSRAGIGAAVAIATGVRRAVIRVAFQRCRRQRFLAATLSLPLAAIGTLHWCHLLTVRREILHCLGTDCL